MKDKSNKIKLLEAIKEKKRRLKEARPPYTPNSGQANVHQSRAKARFCFAGNGGGKTVMAAHEAMWAAQGYNPILKEYTPVPATVIVVLDHPDKVEEPWLSTMRKWFNINEDNLKKNGKPYINEYQLDNGSKIKWMFHQQDALTFESLECDYVVFDEPAPRAIYVALRRGGRKKNRRARYLMIGTPISAAWLRIDVYEKWKRGELPDTECFVYGTEANRKNLADGYIEEFSGILSEKERKIRLEGMFYDLDSLALSHLFKRDTHIIARPQFEFLFNPATDPVFIAVDPHPSKNHVACMLGASKDGQLFYIKEMSEKMVARDFARSLKNWYRGYRVVDIVVDSLGSADMTGGEGMKSFIQVMNEEGVRCRATTYDEKSDEAFIESIRDVLKVPDKPNNFGLYVPKLRILQGNPGIVRDIENVSWLKHKDIDVHKEKLDTRETDYLSCLKYALASNPSHKRGNERVHKPKTALYGFGPKKISYNWKRRT